MANARTIAVCGRGRLGTTCLGYIVHATRAWGGQTQVVACPSSSDDGSGAYSLRAAAGSLGIPVGRLADHYDTPGLVVLSLQYDRIIRVERFADARLYNLHFSLLPAFRGVYPSIWPILAGASRVGVTLHVLDAGIDTGDIIAQAPFDLPPRITADQLYERFVDEGIGLLQRHLRDLVTGAVQATPQDHGAASYYDRKSIDFSALEVDPSWSADAVDRFVRAFHFPAHQLARFRGRDVRGVLRVAGVREEPPGTVLQETSAGVTVVVDGGEVVFLVQ